MNSNNQEHGMHILQKNLRSFRRCSTTGLVILALSLLLPACAPSSSMAPTGAVEVSPTPAASATTASSPTQTQVASSSVKEFRSSEAGVSLQYPAGWQADGEQGYRGSDGFFQLKSLDLQFPRIDMACTLEVNQEGAPYGAAPRVSLGAVGKLDACIIQASAKDDQAQSAILFANPAGKVYALSMDPLHLESIGQTLQLAPTGTTTAQPESHPTINPQPPLASPTLTASTFGSLAVEDYAIVAESEDSPDHFEFRQRIPEAVFEKRAAWRGYGLSSKIDLANEQLKPFGYSFSIPAGQPTPENGSRDTAQLKKGDEIIKEVDYFWGVEVNASKTDFALVVEENSGGTWLVQKESVQPWDTSLHAGTTPVFVEDLLTWAQWEEGTQNFVVEQDGKPVFSYVIADVGVDNPVKSLHAWDGHWVMEVKGLLLVDGRVINLEKGYSEVFNWQIVAGEPFYFFEKGGQVGISYAGQDLPLQFDEVIHYRCCEPAAFNTGSNANMVWFYARSGGWWRYVELGNYRSNR